MEIAQGHARDAGFEWPEATENRVLPPCFRVADLAVLLKQAGQSGSRYTRHLRREPDVEYDEGDVDT